MSNNGILKNAQVIHRKSEKDKQSRGKQNKQKKNNKMSNLNISIAIIT